MKKWDLGCDYPVAKQAWQEVKPAYSPRIKFESADN